MSHPSEINGTTVQHQHHQSIFYSPASSGSTGSLNSSLRPSISCQHAINAGKSHQKRQQHCSIIGHTRKIGSKRNADIKPNKISWLGKGSVWFIKTFMDTIPWLAFLQAVTRKRNMAGGIPDPRFYTFLATSAQIVLSSQPAVQQFAGSHIYFQPDQHPNLQLHHLLCQNKVEGRNKQPIRKAHLLYNFSSLAQVLQPNFLLTFLCTLPHNYGFQYHRYVPSFLSKFFQISLRGDIYQSAETKIELEKKAAYGDQPVNKAPAERMMTTSKRAIKNFPTLGLTGAE